LLQLPHKALKPRPLGIDRKNGRRERIRTSGPHVPNVVLYQAELLSDDPGKGVLIAMPPRPRNRRKTQGLNGKFASLRPLIGPPGLYRIERMILVGQYDSPFVRRVAISLRLLGFTYEHDTRSVFGDFDSMLKTNPLGRIPSLLLDDGRTLLDSAAILDWLDEKVGPERALIPASGAARADALQRIALATGSIDKIGAANYERLIRPSAYRWPEWIARCLTQCRGGIEALERLDWTGAKVDQAQITTGCFIFYARVTDPALMPEGRYPVLDKLATKLGAMAEFRDTAFTDYAVPRGE
jgi:glutathione S-transferase